MEILQNQRKVLMLGADPLVCDNVRVLLTSMGFQCLVASALKKALELLEQEKPDAVIVDPYFTDAPAVRLAAMFYKQVPALRGRSIGWAPFSKTCGPAWFPSSAGLLFPGKSRMPRCWSSIVFSNPRSWVSDRPGSRAANSVMNPTPSQRTFCSKGREIRNASL